MYPDAEILQEVGRLTIAGARLDVEMGMLWHHLDRAVPLEVTRIKPGAEQCRRIRALASARLVGDLREAVLAAVDLSEQARQSRNEVVHQSWLLRGRDAMRPVSELAAVPPEQMDEYVEGWRREAKPSPDWQRIPARSTDVETAQSVAELRHVERALAGAAAAVSELTFAVASARETGRPVGYVHP